MTKKKSEKANKPPKEKKAKAAPETAAPAETTTPAAEQQPQEIPAGANAIASVEQTQTTEPVAATGSQTWVLTAQQAEKYRTDLLLFVASKGERGVVQVDTLAAWGAQQSVGWHPEVFHKLEEDQLLTRDIDQIKLTVDGCLRVMAIRDQAAAELLAQERAINEAHAEYAKGEQVLLLERDTAKREIEEVRGILNAKKLALESVEDRIAAYMKQGPQIKATTGAKQQSLLDLPEVKAAGAKQSGIAAGWRDMLPGVENDRVIVSEGDEEDLPTQQQVLDAIVLPIVFEADNRVLGLEKTVMVAGHRCLVSACWRDTATHESRANLLRLFTHAEWYDLFAKDLGPAVEGHDATDEGRDKRQREGAWCGLVVRIDNEPLVVGPQSHALHIVHNGPAAAKAKEPAAEDAGHDGKAAAAGEGREPELVVVDGLDQEGAGAPAEPPAAAGDEDDEHEPSEHQDEAG